MDEGPQVRPAHPERRRVQTLRADSDVDGGFLGGAQQVLTQLIKAVDDIVVMRRLGTVMQLDRAGVARRAGAGHGPERRRLDQRACDRE